MLGLYNLFFFNLFILGVLGLHCYGPSLVAVGRGYSLLQCMGFSLR